MPSTYAHYRLGQEVLKGLSVDAGRIINNNKELYDIGLHGPDILFYYKPLFSCEVNKQGYDMHARSGKMFFENAAKVLSETDEGQKEAALAYIYGFCCHFALDVSCHKYIDEKIAADGVSHTEIEVEFDRSLMENDGYNPVTHILTNHIHASYENAEVISRFYENLTPKQVKKSLESMIYYNRLLIAPSQLKRKLIYGLLRITGNYKEMHGLIVNYRPNPLCDDSTKKLYSLYENALKLAALLIGEFKDSAVGNIDFNAIYEFTFGSQLPGVLASENEVSGAVNIGREAV